MCVVVHTLSLTAYSGWLVLVQDLELATDLEARDFGSRVCGRGAKSEDAEVRRCGRRCRTCTCRVARC